jgi:hypothetical protein
MDFPCSLPALAGAIVFCLAAGPAVAQAYRPNAEGYPCAAVPALSVVPGEDGFSIRATIRRSGSSSAPAQIKIGSSLSLDSRIFAPFPRTEVSHVSQR